MERLGTTSRNPRSVVHPAHGCKSPSEHKQRRLRAAPGLEGRRGALCPALGSNMEMPYGSDKSQHPSRISTGPAGTVNPYATATAGVLSTFKCSQADTTRRSAQLLLMPKHHNLCPVQLGIPGMPSSSSWKKQEPSLRAESGTQALDVHKK